jgi:hypothetical protein
VVSVSEGGARSGGAVIEELARERLGFEHGYRELFVPLVVRRGLPRPA